MYFDRNLEPLVINNLFQTANFIIEVVKIRKINYVSRPIKSIIKCF